MDPEQMFIRVQERFSKILTPRIRATLEYLYLFLAVTSLCILVFMHANYVQQPGCSSEISKVEWSEAHLIQIKITSAGFWLQDESDNSVIDSPGKEANTEAVAIENGDSDRSTLSTARFWLNWITSGAWRGKSPLNISKTDDESLESQTESSISSGSSEPAANDAVVKVNKEVSSGRFSLSLKESLKAAVTSLGQKWHRRLSCVWKIAKKILGGLWDISGIHLDLGIPKWLKLRYLIKLKSYAVKWLEKRSKGFEPAYLYTMEKGYFFLHEEAKLRHNIHTINISISARHPCFGNRWQQLLINKLVGYDTILMNSFQNFLGQGYFYNYQTEEFYNLTYAHEQPESSARFGDYFVTKCGVLMMSVFIFFATTMSVSFTLRETQTRMLKFTVQLQHHAQQRLPTFQLVFVHVIESLVFVPTMIGILFFLFEFYDDQILAFMVLILVWLSELFTLISVRTPISMKFFPRFFLLYFLVFHIYFFSYTDGFSYLALFTAAAFIQHLILYFWNHFEVPALQRFVQNRQSQQLQRHLDLRSASTILAPTLHITRFSARNPSPNNIDLTSRQVLRGGVGEAEFSGLQDQPDLPDS